MHIFEQDTSLTLCSCCAHTTVVLLIFEEDTSEGKSGCNRWFHDV